MNHPSAVFVQLKRNDFGASSPGGTTVIFYLRGCSCFSNQSRYVTLTFLVYSAPQDGLAFTSPLPGVDQFFVEKLCELWYTKDASECVQM